MTRHDGAWLDRMYNNRALVPQHQEHFSRWAKLSAEARDSEEHELDIHYGSGPSEQLDVFPAAQPNAPVVVFIHGGYWRSLDKSDHSFVAPVLTRSGACVVIPNYALCPAVTIPQITMQMVHALAWTWSHAARFGGDPQRIAVMGHSAGGHLATMMLACAWHTFSKSLPENLVRNALSISGLYDLDAIRRTPFLQASLRLTPAQVRRASPALLQAPAHGTLATVAGADESEEFLRQNRLMRAAWGEERVPVCEALPGLNHFSVLEALLEPGHRLHQLAQALIAR